MRKVLLFLIDKKTWPIPKIFQILQKKGKISDKELYTTFNMGIGLAMVVNKKECEKVRIFLKLKKIKHYEIGEVIQNTKGRTIILIYLSSVQVGVNMFWLGK